MRGFGLHVFSFVDSGGADPGGAILGGVVRLGGVPRVLVCPCPQLRPDTSARRVCSPSSAARLVFACNLLGGLVSCVCVQCQIVSWVQLSVSLSPWMVLLI